MKKRIKKKLRKFNKRKKLRRRRRKIRKLIIKKKFKSRKKVKKIKHRKKTKKIKKKIKIRKKKKLTKIKKLHRKIKRPQSFKFNKKVQQLKSLTLQKVISFIFKPIVNVYDEYREKRKNEKIKQANFERKEKEKLIKQEARLREQLKQNALKDELTFAKLRERDLKQFLRKEQAEIRAAQKEKEKKFLQQIKIQKKLERFRRLELEEIKQLEKFSLKHQRDSYQPTLDRIEAIKEKYRILREERIRSRIKALGLDISDLDTKEDLIQKEKDYTLGRQQIELALAPFFRSAQSLVFQLNKRYIPKHKSILRVINRIFETNELFIRYDDVPDEEWLVLVYLKDSDPKRGEIIVENRSNPEKNETKEFKLREIFSYSDYLVDVFTSHIDRIRQKKAS